MMNNNTHRLSGRYCPVCYQPLRQRISHPEIEYCYLPGCDYEVSDGLPPLTKDGLIAVLIKRKKEQAAEIDKAIDELNK